MPSPLQAEADLARELTFKVEGMWCTACSWLIEQVAGKMNGVLEAKTDFLSDLVQIRYLPHRINPEDILQRIARLGYSPSRLTDFTALQERKRLLLRLGISAILTANVMMISFALYFGFFQELGEGAIEYFSYPLWALATPVVFYGGGPILKRALAGLRLGHTTMDTLIAVGALSAYCYSAARVVGGSLHLYFDTASMLVTLVLLGKFIEARAREKVSGGMAELHRLASQKARLLHEGGERWVAAEAVRPGDEVLVAGGERVAVDGRIVAGQAMLDESVLTGESKPVRKSVGDQVMAGALLLDGDLRLRATRVGGDSSLGQMLAMTRQALAAKAPVEVLADRITRWLVPAVLVLAAATASALLLRHVACDEALLRAVTVLVITCPCALGIATPLAKVAAVAAARANGILIRDTAAFEKAADVDVLVFDKTGTVTEGSFVLREIISDGATQRDVLQKVACVEAESDHFLAREILRKAAQSSLPLDRVTHFEPLQGLGVKGTVGGNEMVVGNRQLMHSHGMELPARLDRHAEKLEANGSTVVLAGWDGRVRGLFGFGDQLKESAGPTFCELRSRRVDTWLVSGDSAQTTRAVGEELGVTGSLGQVLPQEKAKFVANLQRQGLCVGMVGDGINDAAALARADVGLATGGGANLVQEAAGITIIGGSPAKVLAALDLSRLTGRIIRQNLFFAFFYNILGIPLAVCGLLNPLAAVFAMFASSLTVIGNTLRISRFTAGEVHSDGADAAITPRHLVSRQGAGKDSR